MLGLSPMNVMICELANQKVSDFTDSMLEDIQDIIKVEWGNEIDFNHGILPPRYKELKEELAEMLTKYLMENVTFNPQLEDYVE